jgi:5-formyltetrahydrofolate cyclo-ligase
MKAALRKRMLALRSTFPAGARAERSALLVERLASVEPIARARSVALFHPIEARCEVDLRALDSLLRQRGVRIAYPRMDPMEPGAMDFRIVPDLERLSVHSLGMREPGPDDLVANPGDLEAIVVPALAVDCRGYRIGYGMGCYDRQLPRHSPPAVTIAVAFDFQLVVEIPSDAHDVPVDWVATDARVVCTKE